MNDASHKQLNNTISGSDSEEYMAIGLVWDSKDNRKTEWMEKLAQTAKRKGHKIVKILPAELKNQNYKEQDDQNTQAGYLRNLKEINIFIIDDSIYPSIHFPKKSLAVGIRLNLCNLDDILNTILPLPAQFDGWICPQVLPKSVLNSLHELWLNYTNPKLFYRENTKFYILPMYLAENSARYVIYAPEKLPDEETSHFAKRVIRGIRILLSSFPCHKIILNLQNESLSVSETEIILTSFAKEERLSLCQRPDDNNFTEASILVSESDKIAKSFYSVSGQPAIHINIGGKGKNVVAREYGFEIYSYKNLVRTIKNYFGEEVIANFKDESSLINDCNFDLLLQNLFDFYYSRPHENWTLFVCEPVKNFCSDVDIVLKSLNLPRRKITKVIAYAAIFGLSDSRLLTAFALHLGINLDPSLLLREELKTLLSNFTKTNIAANRYYEIDPQVVKMLYSYALLDFIKTNNIEGKELTEILSDEFEEAANEKRNGAEVIHSTNKYLGFYELKIKLIFLSKDIFVVGFYINNYCRQDEWLNALSVECGKAGYLTIGLITPQNVSKCDMESMQINAIVEAGQVKELKRINVFIISDFDQISDFPLSSKVLGVVHNFYLPVNPASCSDALHAMVGLDGWIQPSLLTHESRIRIKNLWEGFIHPAYCKRGNNDFYLISEGYPRLESTQKKIKKINVEPDSIIYAPREIAYTQKIRNEAHIQDYGLRIIRALLDRFPDKKVIFRPAQGDLNHPSVREITSSLENENRFILDKFSDHAYSFSRGTSLITDSSTIIWSFSFLMSRPSIILNISPDSRDDICKLTDFGFSVNGIEGMLKALTIYFNETSIHSERIETARKKRIAPITDSLDRIAKFLPDFYKGICHDTWIKIERNYAAGKKSVDLISVMTKYGKNDPALAFQAVSSNPKDPLLLAYALHTGKAICPQSELIHELRYYIDAYFNVEIPKRFNDVKPEMIMVLYAMARDSMGKDIKSVNIINKLIESVRADF